MTAFSTIERLLILSALAGVVHVLAPDHWLPASLLAWQKRWTFSRTVAFSTLFFLIHMILGFLMCLVFLPFVGNFDSLPLLFFALVLVFAAMVIRGQRFSRIREVLFSGSHGSWGVFAVISLLGPAESMIPIWLKARHLGMGYFMPFLAFFAGTLLAGVSCVILGRLQWDRPFSLGHAMSWANRRASVLPVIAGVGIGLTVILGMTS